MQAWLTIQVEKDTTAANQTFQEYTDFISHSRQSVRRSIRRWRRDSRGRRRESRERSRDNQRGTTTERHRILKRASRKAGEARCPRQRQETQAWIRKYSFTFQDDFVSLDVVNPCAHARRKKHIRTFKETRLRKKKKERKRWKSFVNASVRAESERNYGGN